MKQNRVIKLIILIVLMFTIIFCLSACADYNFNTFCSEYNINSIGDFFNFVYFIFIALIYKIFVMPIQELFSFILLFV